MRKRGKTLKLVKGRGGRYLLITKRYFMGIKISRHSQAYQSKEEAHQAYLYSKYKMFRR